MDACDALIVGGGPAGSACAWALSRAGLDVAILDKSVFPRDKVCGGWITLQVIDALELDILDYSRARTLQPITGFKTSCMSNRETEMDYARPVSYGIRRVEFDDYLLRRSGARLFEGESVRKIERNGASWLINGHVRAGVLVGAGGHFCPVARHINPGMRDAVVVAAQETEFEMTPSQQKMCSIRGEIPELYFCRDLRGYGWCFRKGNFLNVGLGRLDPHRLGAHVAGFVDFLRRTRKVAFDLPSKLLGHAYLLYGRANRKVTAGGVMLIGDAAGMAYAQSGEGIRPAIESGLLAAQVLVEANGKYTADRLSLYGDRLAERFGNQQEWSSQIGSKLPPRLMSSLGRLLLATPWFSRRVVIEKWFLHSNDPALIVQPEAVTASSLP
ncbi:MAG TPA: NAD(P)/FAD-dependent oxidoreductase [Candidatus Acidoferrales bacterium]|nr:NAD(P)/FAD-dependent oxidoreductase [Candidatus Acidoferrales bacterium]